MTSLFQVRTGTKVPVSKKRGILRTTNYSLAKRMMGILNMTNVVWSKNGDTLVWNAVSILIWIYIDTYIYVYVFCFQQFFFQVFFTHIFKFIFGKTMYKKQTAKDTHKEYIHILCIIYQISYFFIIYDRLYMYIYHEFHIPPGLRVFFVEGDGSLALPSSSFGTAPWRPFWGFMKYWNVRIRADKYIWIYQTYR